MRGKPVHREGWSAHRASMLSTVALALCLVAPVCLMGCQHAPPASPLPPEIMPPPPWEGPPPPATMPELSVLGGRRICLDPGHGGPWPGAVAGNGLRESDVNLRVALCLERLLADAGAEVLLTRRTDEALDGGGVTADLAARAKISNAWPSEVFVSIHHNADITAGSPRNDMEVYYKWGEDGPSLELGQAMLYAFAHWLRPEDGQPDLDPSLPKKLLPGNYHVLRASETPSVLLESSYMSHADNSAWLATDEAVISEARAIAAGLALYFSTDPPLAGATELQGGPETGGYVMRVAFRKGGVLDASTVSVWVDGEPSEGRAWVDGDAVLWAFGELLPNGRHAIRLKVRNQQGAAGVTRTTFDINRPATRIDVLQAPVEVKRGSGVVAQFEARVVDAFGMPVADGTAITLRETGVTQSTIDGAARFLVKEKPEALTFTCGSIQENVAWRRGEAAYKTVEVLDGVSKQPVGEALLQGGTATVLTTPEGWGAFPGSVESARIAARGYADVEVRLSSSHTRVELEPVSGGVLHGFRVVLDPADGGLSAGQVGPDGLRASDVSLSTALIAAAQLREAGAIVTVTRQGDEEWTDLQRLDTVQQVNAEIYVGISYGMGASKARVITVKDATGGSEGPFVGHYPGSGQGNRLATLLSAASGGLRVIESAAFLLQQTPCPAVLFYPMPVEKGSLPWTLAQERSKRDASAIVSALIQFRRTPKQN